MTSISTRSKAMSPATPGVREAPPNQSAGPTTTFAAVIAPFTAPRPRQDGKAPGNALPVEPRDPGPEDRRIEAASAKTTGDSSDGEENGKSGPADDSDSRTIDPILGWLGVAPTPADPSIEPPALPATGIGGPHPSLVASVGPRRPDYSLDDDAFPPSPARPVSQPAGATTDLPPIPQILPHGREASPFPQTESTPLTAADLAATATMLPQAVAPVATANQAALDLAHHGWPQAMIDRIEALRDNADAVDTRIRIAPDALGTIDVSMRRQGQITHVHFAADQAQTRQILADAQPRLAELAESRGLKLAQGGVDSGAGQQQRHQPAAPAPRARIRAALAEAASDHRIA